MTFNVFAHFTLLDLSTSVLSDSSTFGLDGKKGVLLGP